jgi:hypothetical protein
MPTLAEEAKRGRFVYIFGPELLGSDTSRARRASQKRRTPNRERRTLNANGP